MLNWFKDLLGLKTSKKLPTNYCGLLKSDMLYELSVIKSLKRDFDGVDDNILLHLIAIEDLLKDGLEDCVDDSLEDGEYPVFMGWNEDEE